MRQYTVSFLCPLCREALWAGRRFVFDSISPKGQGTTGPGGDADGRQLWSPGPLTWVTDHFSTMGCVIHGRALARSCSSRDSLWEMGDFLFRQYVIVSWLPASNEGTAHCQPSSPLCARSCPRDTQRTRRGHANHRAPMVASKYTSTQNLLMGPDVETGSMQM